MHHLGQAIVGHIWKKHGGEKLNKCNQCDYASSRACCLKTLRREVKQKQPVRVYILSGGQFEKTFKNTPCTMDQAHRKFVIRDFAKNDYLWLPFSQAWINFRLIFGCYLLCSFTFNFYLGTSWRQIFAAVKLYEIVYYTSILLRQNQPLPSLISISWNSRL